MELHTQRLLLREFTADDAIGAHAYESDPEVIRYTSHGIRTLDESRAYVARSIESASQSPRTTCDLAVVLRESGLYVGRCGVHLARPDQQEAEIWYILDRSHWGKGYIPEAMEALITFAFDKLPVRRIIADLDPRNHASARVCEKLGMRREAHFVENVLIKGEWCDTVIYAILHREWHSRSA